jgi:hypothetical protein
MAPPHRARGVSGYAVPPVAKKRQTFGKIQRERERAEKRQRKLEKKEEKKALALEAAELGITVEELAARRGLGPEEPADEEFTPTQPSASSGP